MSHKSVLLPIACLLLLPFANAKEKDRIALPVDILKAQTVVVVILPEAGEPLADPKANRKAQEDVEIALMKWGRFRLATETLTADLVIAVRKGTKKSVTPVIKGGPVDTRPIILERTGGSTRVGAQAGDAPDLTQNGGSKKDAPPGTGAEVGPSEDTFEVFRGATEYPLDSSPVWHYTAKDSLSAPAVAAVTEFRKAIDASVKAQAQKQQKKQP